MKLAFRDKNITGSGGQIIQVDVLSEAVQSDVGKIYQYIGETTDEFTNGYFYKCIANDDGTYSWSNVPVQEGNGDASLSFWQPNTAYKVNDLCLYKNTDYYSLYICTTEHTSADVFVSAYWETIDGTEFEGYTKEEIEAMTDLILDTEVRTDKTYSSFKIEERIDDKIDEKLFEDKENKIIDVPESYTRCLDTDTGVLKVVADGSLTDATTEVEISAVVGFIDDIAEGEYVLHTEEVSHIETETVSIYMPREETYNKQEIDDKIVQATTGLENYNFDDWSNFYNGLTVTSNKVDTP